MRPGEPTKDVRVEEVPVRYLKQMVVTHRGARRSSAMTAGGSPGEAQTSNSVKSNRLSGQAVWSKKSKGDGGSNFHNFSVNLELL